MIDAFGLFNMAVSTHCPFARLSSYWLSQALHTRRVLEKTTESSGTTDQIWS